MKTATYTKFGKRHFMAIGDSCGNLITSPMYKEFSGKVAAKKWAREQNLKAWNY